MGDFRRNVEPDKRRKTNKALLELKEFQCEYNSSRDEVDVCDRRLQAENEKLTRATLVLEEVRNLLSSVQEEIDADYLPEGAQPRPRIQRRDELSLVSPSQQNSLIGSIKIAFFIFVNSKLGSLRRN